MRRFIYIVLLTILSLHLKACSKGAALPETGLDTSNIQNKAIMKIKMTIGAKTAKGELYDNQAGRDLASLLPLSLNLTDYNGTEKIADLSKKLDTSNAPAGFDPSTGDITYYAPWGNLAIFYKDFGNSSGLVSLGMITSGMDAFSVGGTIAVKIELEK